MEKQYYYSFAQYCKETFHRKLYKVPLNAGFTCPNRDGTIDNRGCIFCDGDGSGDFAIAYDGQPLTKQNCIYSFQNANIGDYIAYFQAYTNTYGPPERLYRLYRSALENPLFAGISIASRPDCFGDDVLEVLAQLQQEYPDKFIWVELGLQTIHEESAVWMRRGYPLSVFEDTVRKLDVLHIPVIVHVIIGLPNETDEMMIETIRYLNTTPISGIKLQLLHYLNGTDMGEMYLANPKQFHIMDKQEYIDLVVRCIGNLRPDIVIHRLTGDGNSDILLAPKWSMKKGAILNAIRHCCKEYGIYQGSLLYKAN